MKTATNQDVGNRVLISSLPPSMSERKLRALMQSVGDVEVSYPFFLKRNKQKPFLKEIFLYTNNIFVE